MDADNPVVSFKEPDTLRMLVAKLPQAEQAPIRKAANIIIRSNTTRAFLTMDISSQI